jgi:hypothetical protein
MDLELLLRRPWDPTKLPVILYNVIFVQSIAAIVCRFVILVPINVVSLEGISLGSQFSSL